MALAPLAADEQLALTGAWVNDPRGRAATGIPAIDGLLDRGGLAPGDFVVFGGKSRTRKTTTVLNLIKNFLEQEVPVGLVGLDETKPRYVLKLMSAMTGDTVKDIQEAWDAPDGEMLRERYAYLASRLSLSDGFEPTKADLEAWLNQAEVATGHRPQVVVLDYLALLAKGKYDGNENSRIPKLTRELQIFCSEQEVVTIALHQVGRFDEGSSGRYHGHTPMSLESLKHGGEEYADIVLGSYRPALDPLGHMSFDDAMAYLPDSWKDETREKRWSEATARVKKYRNSTFIQLLKNRPGVDTLEEGTELVSEGKSMLMRPAGKLNDLDMLRVGEG